MLNMHHVTFSRGHAPFSGPSGKRGDDMAAFSRRNLGNRSKTNFVLNEW